MPDPNTTEDASTSPGKTRTWWHPLLVSLLDAELRDAYEVRDEVQVGKMPLRVDIVLIRRQKGRLKASARRDLAALVARLNRLTLLEFKSPTDALARGDLDTLLGCAHLFRAGEAKPIHASDLSLVIIAPRLTKPFRDDLKRSLLAIREVEPCIHEIDGGMFTTSMIETDRVAGMEEAEPILSLLSHVFLCDPDGIIEPMKRRGYDALLSYVVQQVQQFQAVDEAFEMQYQVDDSLEKVAVVFRRHQIDELIEDGVPSEVWRKMSAEEVMRELPAESASGCASSWKKKTPPRRPPRPPAAACACSSSGFRISATRICSFRRRDDEPGGGWGCPFLGVDSMGDEKGRVDRIDEEELERRRQVVARIDALRERLASIYGEMPDSTKLIREDRLR